MEKKEIYEHLARIYLDASLKYKKKKKFSHHFLLLLLPIIGIILFLSISLFNPNKITSLDKKTTLVLSYEPIKINFNFQPVKKEFYSIDFNNKLK